jgi:hypothetical protein
VSAAPFTETLPNSSFTTMTLAEVPIREDFDTADIFDPATPTVLTAPRAGLYRANLIVRFESNGATDGRDLLGFPESVEWSPTRSVRLELQHHLPGSVAWLRCRQRLAWGQGRRGDAPGSSTIHRPLQP